VNAYEGKTQAWRKVMAAYHQGMTCKLTACTLGPMLGNKYGRTLPFMNVLYYSAF